MGGLNENKAKLSQPAGAGVGAWLSLAISELKVSVWNIYWIVSSSKVHLNYLIKLKGNRKLILIHEMKLVSFLKDMKVNMEVKLTPSV